MAFITHHCNKVLTSCTGCPDNFVFGNSDFGIPDECKYAVQCEKMCARPARAP